MARRWLAGRVGLAGVALSLLTVVAGCGSGPTAQEWAGDVCTALAPWRAQISELNARANQELANASTATQAKASLIDLLAGAEAASETARAGVAAAGVPDASGGAEVARRFTASLAGARDAYARARAAVQALPADDDQAFYDAVVPVLTRLNTEYEASGVDTTSLASVELRDAFDGAAQCR
ncbi:MAG TPA: hypothetical protein VF163_00625 [Micromonosporaceae bacterium]